VEVMAAWAASSGRLSSLLQAQWVRKAPPAVPVAALPMNSLREMISWPGGFCQDAIFFSVEPVKAQVYLYLAI